MLLSLGHHGAVLLAHDPLRAGGTTGDAAASAMLVEKNRPHLRKIGPFLCFDFIGELLEALEVLCCEHGPPALQTLIEDAGEAPMEVGVQGTTQRFFVDSCGPGNVREGVESEPGGDLEDFIVRAAGGAAAVPVSLPQVHPDVRTAMDARAPGTNRSRRPSVQ